VVLKISVSFDVFVTASEFSPNPFLVKVRFWRAKNEIKCSGKSSEIYRVAQKSLHDRNLLAESHIIR